MCAKCEKEEEVTNEGEPDKATQQRTEDQAREHLKLFRERTRRTILRKIENGEMEAADILDMEPDRKSVLDDDEFDDLDDMDEDMDSEE